MTRAIASSMFTPTQILWVGGVSLGLLAISLVLVVILILALPAEFFLERHNRQLWIDHHPLIRWSAIVAKNLLGLALVALGVVLSVPAVPGQGLLTMLLGLILLDIPGKRGLERWLVSLPHVARTINGLRARFGRPPLVLDETAE